MAQIFTGGRDSYRALRFGEMSSGLDKSFMEYGHKLMNNLGGASEHAKHFYAESLATFDAFNQINYAELRKTLLRQSENIFHDDVVMPCITVEDFRAANGISRQLIMACPELRTKAQRQQIEGYAECYTDPFSTFSNELHPDYMRVTDGVLMTDPKTDETWSISYEFDDHELDLPELSIDDKAITLTNWDMARILLQVPDGEDFTNIAGGKLG